MQSDVDLDGLHRYANAVIGVPKKRATLADFLAIPEADRFHEILDGELVQKAQPTPRHASAQAKFGELLGPFNRRIGGPPDRPGGWWILSEVDVLFDEAPLRPDVSGWRRERMLELPNDAIVPLVPDWICEILSSHRSRDTVKKQRIYHRHRVSHYWLLDPQSETLTVLRWQETGYLEALVAERGETVRAEPFDAIEIRIGAFFGDD